MSNNRIAAISIFSSRPEAEYCIDSLLSDGFSDEEISVLLSHPDTTRHLGVEKVVKAPEAVTAGPTTAGAFGGPLGLLAGIGELAIPGAGSFIAAGPIMATLARVGSAAGGIIGTLVGMGLPENEARFYESHVKKGGVLVSVHCETPDLVAQAKDILASSGAEDISSVMEAYGSFSVRKVARQGAASSVALTLEGP